MLEVLYLVEIVALEGYWVEFVSVTSPTVIAGLAVKFGTGVTMVVSPAVGWPYLARSSGTPNGSDSTHA